MRTKTDGLSHVALVLSLNKRFDRKVIEGVSRFVHEIGTWRLFLEDNPHYKVPDFKKIRFDGVLADLDDRNIPQAVANLKIPVVGIGAIDPQHELAAKIFTVGTDNRKIATMAAEYLVGLGLKSFGYCGVPSRTIDPWNQERQNGFHDAIRAAGFTCAIFEADYDPSHNWAQLLDELNAWLRPLPKPVGVLAANDVRARHLLEACQLFGHRVPEDVAVLGVDNDDLICSLSTPPLSSIVQGTEEIGYQAARLLNCLIKRQTNGVRDTLVAPVTIVERVSTDLVATNNKVVAAAVTYIRKHACDGMSVAQVAEAVGVARTTLDNHFRQEAGRTVHAEILRVQLNSAKMLLATTTMSLDEVAKRCGFCNAQYLSTVFRRSCGHTPRAYRLIV